MSRRGGPSVPILIGIVVVGLFLYGFYSYHKVKTDLRLMEEKADRLKVQHESVSAQLQVVYEHKTRLEKAVQEEKAQHKKTRDDLTVEKGTLEDRMRQEKNTLNEDLIRIKMERSKLEENFNTVKNEKQSLQDQFKTYQENYQNEHQALKQEINQQRQECDNEVAQLKDQVADLSRRNVEMGARLQNESSSNVGGVKGIGDNVKKSLHEEQNVMQIAEPGDNKPKGYFEVKSPAPEDRQRMDERQLPPAQKEQVAPPIVKGADADVDNSIPRAVAGEVPDAADNQIIDNRVDRNGVINRTQPGAPDGVIKVRNPEPVQVPVPAQKYQEGAIDRPDGLGQPGQENLPDQVAQRRQDIRQGLIEVPGQIINHVQGDNPDGNIGDEEGEDEQAQNNNELNNPGAKQKADSEQEDYEGVGVGREDRAKDM